MRAARFDAASRTLRVHDVPIPEPAPNEVLVRVEACGICLSERATCSRAPCRARCPS
jgi:D-arabinose 1-dehydrogenase-like Zn-dependent alcohol dehydrogenase